MAITIKNSLIKNNCGLVSLYHREDCQTTDDMSLKLGYIHTVSHGI